MPEYGLVIAPSGSGASRDPGMILDSKIAQFKYYKVVFIDLAFGATAPAGNTSVAFSYPHGLLYKPSFMTYIHGHTWDANDRWGLPFRGGQAIGAGGNTEFPYTMFDESVDANNYTGTLVVFNTTGVSYPAHTVTIRLTLLFDEVQ